MFDFTFIDTTNTENFSMNFKSYDIRVYNLSLRGFFVVRVHVRSLFEVKREKEKKSSHYI